MASWISRWRAHRRRQVKGRRSVWNGRWTDACARLWAWFNQSAPSKKNLERMERHHARLMALCRHRPHRVEWANVIRGMGSLFLWAPTHPSPSRVHQRTQA